MGKKLISLAVAFVMVFSLSIPAFANEIQTADYMTLDELNERHNAVRELQSQRSILQMEQYKETDVAIATASIDNNESKIAEISNQLEELGVREVALSELSFVTKSRSIEVPEATNESWELEEYTNILYRGTRYDVYVLTAQSKNINSMLFNKNVKILAAAPGIAAGTADYVRIIATAVSGTIGTVAGSIYDALITTISNLSKSTIIENVSATYQWQCDTIMHFVYVKQTGSSSEPRLCYAYNEASTLVKCTTDNITFNTGTPNILGFEDYSARQSGIMNGNANNLNNAIDSFINYSQIMHSFVCYVTISGVGNKSIVKQPICQEVYPSMID